MVLCPNCSAQLQDGTAVCPYCGAQIPSAFQQNPQPDYQQPNYQQPNYQQPNYQGGYQQPNYQGGYQQPGYQQPNYQGGYQQPGYQPTRGPMGGYRANIKKRDIAITIILSIVTCGIYGLIWFFYLVNDLNVAAQTPTDKTPGMVLLLSIVTCGIYGIIWVYQAGEKVDKIRQMNGEAPSNSGLIYLLLSIFGLGIVAYCMIQMELNKVAALE